MAYEIAPTEVAAHGVTLAANTVETVTFHRWPEVVQVVSDGTEEVFYTLDTSEPTVGGAHCYWLPKGVMSVDSHAVPKSVGTVTVKLVSAGAPVVSILKGV